MTFEQWWRLRGQKEFASAALNGAHYEKLARLVWEAHEQIKKEDK